MEFTSRYHASAEQITSEFAVIEAAKLDAANFAPLYNKYYKPIFSYVFARMEDKDTAFDVTAQVFLKALQNLHRYEFKGVPFASWLYRIAQSEVYQMFRDKKAERIVNADISDFRNLFEEIQESQYEEHLPRVMEIIKKLPEDEIQLIEMRFFEKRAFREISEIMMITENNAKVKMYRVLEKIKKILTGKPR
jgi:RNA polymerase sigma-70 factor (ECF subfamily)